jgi:GATA zinc finger
MLKCVQKRATGSPRCHSCNTTDTPEWRRGPDGARTLCNACGLRKESFSDLIDSKELPHNSVSSCYFSAIDYAKLMRKSEKKPA